MDIAKIEEFIQVLEGSRVAELTIRRDGSLVTVKRSPTAAPPRPPKAQAKPAPVSQEKASAPSEVAVTAPMVGIFHASGENLQPGSVIAVGQIVGAIESMKLMNDVVAQVSGTVAEVDAEDGLPVEYGQTLFTVIP
jgi:acetyl-CoA carboxylase biotin carboxyl carrier protein